MEFKFFDIVVTLILNFVYFTSSQNFRPCNLTKLEPCPGDNQVCNEATLTCMCDENSKAIGNHCEDYPDITPSHSGTMAVVTIFTLALIIGGLILVAKKYQLVDYVRDRINWRRNDNMMYEDVMIGQDDPPINP